MHSNKILNFQDSTTILNTCTKKTGNLWKALRKRTSGDDPNYYIIENVQDTEKSPGDLLSLTLK